MSKMTYTEIASACVGTPYGHVPGHQFRDVDVTIGRRGERIRVEVKESWGSAQGYDEVHGAKRVVAIDGDVGAACRVARQRAIEAGIGIEYMAQALSEAEAEAIDALDAIGDARNVA